MCEFISWIEKPGKDPTQPVILFLTGDDVFRSEKGAALRKNTGGDDYMGHGFIRLWLGIEQWEGVDKECADFSTPDNFPAAIVQSLLRGEMRGMPTVRALLTDAAYAEWDAARAKGVFGGEVKWIAARAKWIVAHAEGVAAEEKLTVEAEWDAANAEAFWAAFAVPENRAPAWREIGGET